MAYLSKLQVIQRGGQNRQYYLICPAPLAAALEMEKGEELEWVIKDRNTFEIRRVQGAPRAEGRPPMNQPAAAPRGVAGFGSRFQRSADSLRRWRLQPGRGLSRWIVPS